MAHAIRRIANAARLLCVQRRIRRDGTARQRAPVVILPMRRIDPFDNAQTRPVRAGTMGVVKSVQRGQSCRECLCGGRAGSWALPACRVSWRRSRMCAPITYTFNGTASGRLGSTTFTNAAFAITAVGDTNDVTSIGTGVSCNDFIGAAYTLGGVGSGYITSPLSVAVNTGMQLLALTVGGCVDTSLIWISGYDAQVSAYRLNTGIGPLSLGTPSPQSAVAPDTSSGKLTITDISAMTFQATAGYTLTPVVGLWWNPNESGSGYNLDVKNGVPGRHHLFLQGQRGARSGTSPRGRSRTTASPERSTSMSEANAFRAPTRDSQRLAATMASSRSTFPRPHRQPCRSPADA